MRKRHLDDIAGKIRICTKCPLCKERNNAVPGEGSPEAKVFFIGEAPGRNEDLSGRPFCGAAGKMLDRGLEEAGIAREDVFITSVVKCRPPKNRNPQKEELDSCRPYLEAQIRIISPSIIVLLGNFGLRHFFPEKSIMLERGRIIEKDGRLYFPMLHPAAIIYNRNSMEAYLSDFRALRSIIGTKFK